MVSGAEKRRRRRAAAAAAAVATQASTENATDSSDEDGECRNCFVLSSAQHDSHMRHLEHINFDEGPPAALPTTVDAFRLRKSHLDNSAKNIAIYHARDVTKDWEVAKEKLGVSKAGGTLKEFVRLNTKVSTHSIPNRDRLFMYARRSSRLIPGRDAGKRTLSSQPDPSIHSQST